MNPFKPRVYLALNETTETEVEKSEPMPWRDAAKLALVVMLLQIFVGFLTLWSWAEICLDAPAFLFELFKFSGATFFVTFGSLIGISHYYAGKTS